MGEAGAVNHARIHKQAFAIVWNRIASFTRTDGGTIQGLFAPIWGRSRMLAADGAQLAVKQFVKKHLFRWAAAHDIYLCRGWFAHSDKGQREP